MGEKRGQRDRGMSLNPDLGRILARVWAVSPDKLLRLSGPQSFSSADTVCPLPLKSLTALPGCSLMLCVEPKSQPCTPVDTISQW